MTADCCTRYQEVLMPVQPDKDSFAPESLQIYPSKSKLIYDNKMIHNRSSTEILGNTAYIGELQKRKLFSRISLTFLIQTSFSYRDIVQNVLKRCHRNYEILLGRAQNA